MKVTQMLTADNLVSLGLEASMKAPALSPKEVHGSSSLSFHKAGVSASIRSLWKTRVPMKFGSIGPQMVNNLEYLWFPLV